jgi:hypothetical integral membrane protein (TIGR02206 family)
VGSGVQYWLAVAVSAAIGVAVCAAARRFPGRTAIYVGRGISTVLAADAVAFASGPLFGGSWTARSSLPLNLSDVALVAAAVACWFPQWQLGVELTYFWGLTGTLQAVATPNLSVSFPHLAFLEFVVGHVGIVIAAGYLVVGLWLAPRRGAVPRVLAITAIYTGFVGLVDWITGGDYMYLAREPAHTSLLSVLGPWPWYVASAAGVAVVLFLALDAPFRLTPTRIDRASPARPAGWPRRTVRLPTRRGSPHRTP